MSTLEGDVERVARENAVGRSVPKMNSPALSQSTLDKARLRKFDDARSATIDLVYVLNMVERKGRISDGDLTDIGTYLQAIAGLVAS